MATRTDSRRASVARIAEVLAASGLSEARPLGDDQIAELRTAQRRAWSSDPGAFDKALTASRTAGRAYLAELFPDHQAARATRPVAGSAPAALHRPADSQRGDEL